MRGPMPDTVINAPNSACSTLLTNPKSSSAVSRRWVWMLSATSSPSAGRAPKAVSDTSTR